MKKAVTIFELVLAIVIGTMVWMAAITSDALIHRFFYESMNKIDVLYERDLILLRLENYVSRANNFGWSTDNPSLGDIELSFYGPYGGTGFVKFFYDASENDFIFTDATNTNFTLSSDVSAFSCNLPPSKSNQLEIEELQIFWDLDKFGATDHWLNPRVDLTCSAGQPFVITSFGRAVF